MADETFDSVWDAATATADDRTDGTDYRSGLDADRCGRTTGVTQPRVSDLMRGKVHLFSLDALVNMITAAGLHVEMSVSPAA
ncbi:helix-turn-helix domain-containing protein [Nocardia sp. NPDC051321]|uniref:helix-turn-helix domain-containing protein n=1 Tax=Nocardia sp. NPDC051321 TaxID=3364323 RepID=UPI0037ADA360